MGLWLFVVQLTVSIQARLYRLKVTHTKNTVNALRIIGKLTPIISEGTEFSVCYSLLIYIKRILGDH